MTNPAPISAYQLYVGIDIAATTFTAAWMRCDGRPGAATTFPQSPTGFATLPGQLQATGVAPSATLMCWKPPAVIGLPWR